MIDTATNTVVATIPVGSSPVAIALNGSGTRAYVTNNASASVSVINTPTDTVIAVPSRRNRSGSPSTRRALSFLIASRTANAIAVISTATNTVVASIPAGVVYGLAVNPAGTRVYAALQIANSVAVVDTGTNTVVADVPMGAMPVGVAVHPRGPSPT